MVIFHSYVSLPEGMWVYDRLPHRFLVGFPQHGISTIDDVCVYLDMGINMD